MSNFSLTEEDLILEMGQSGWVAERVTYYLSVDAMQQLVNAAGLQEHNGRLDFETSINDTVADLCLGLERYHSVKTDKKITTSLRHKSKNIEKAAAALLAKIEPLTDDELHWIFGYSFEENSPNVVTVFTQWLHHTRAFQRYAELSPIEVERSTPALMRSFIVQCINILERFTEVPIVRRRGDGADADAQMIHDFMATLFHWLPNEIKNRLPQPVSSLSGVIREAIEIVRAQEKAPNLRT